MDELLTVKEVAAVFRVGGGTVTRMFIDKDLPSMQFGKKSVYRARRKDVLTWLIGQGIPAGMAEAIMGGREKVLTVAEIAGQLSGRAGLTGAGRGRDKCVHVQRPDGKGSDDGMRP